jgi:osmotically-inducible protein OsmY
VAENIARALRAAKLPGSNIDISVSGGVATLSGQIADGRSKDTATHLVSSVPGVVQVDNQLQVASAKRPAQSPVQQAAFNSPFGETDSHIQQVSQNHPAPPAAVDNQAMAERVGAALTNARLSGYDIKIRFIQGTVTLAGSVATPQQRILADQVCRTVPGVRTVDNQLQVHQAAHPSMLQQAVFQDPAQGDPAAQPPMAPMGPMGPAVGPGVDVGYPGAMGGPVPVYSNAVPGTNPTIYNQPYFPPYAWPAQAQYPNSAAIQYPKQYAASAWPYIGPFYPYPQVPLGWRKVTLEWDDGHWMLDFDSRTDRWFWFMNPRNW